MFAYYMGVIVPSAIVLPVVAAVYKHRHWQMPEKLVCCYLVLSGIFNIVARITSARNINNLPLLHLYTVLEFCLLCMVLRSFFTQQRIRLLLVGLAIVFPILASLYISFTHSLYAYNTLPRFLGSLILVLFCIWFLVLDLSRIGANQSTFSFTVVTGLLLYFSSSSALFGLSESIRQNKGLNIIIWNIHATFVLVMYLIFTWAYLSIKRAS